MSRSEESLSDKMQIDDSIKSSDVKETVRKILERIKDRIVETPNDNDCCRIELNAIEEIIKSEMGEELLT